MSDSILELANVEASYGPVQALRGVTLAIYGRSFNTTASGSSSRSVTSTLAPKTEWLTSCPACSARSRTNFGRSVSFSMSAMSLIATISMLSANIRLPTSANHGPRTMVRNP